jgi:hypothetical protein
LVRLSRNSGNVPDNSTYKPYVEYRHACSLSKSSQPWFLAYGWV